MAQVESLNQLGEWYDPSSWFMDTAAEQMKKSIEKSTGQPAIQLTKEQATGPSYKGPTASDYAEESKKKIQAELAAKAASKSVVQAGATITPETVVETPIDWKKILLVGGGAILILAGVVLFLKQRKSK